MKTIRKVYAFQIESITNMVLSDLKESLGGSLNFTLIFGEVNNKYVQ